MISQKVKSPFFIISFFLGLIFLFHTPVCLSSQDLKTQLVDEGIIKKRFKAFLMANSPWDKGEMEISDLKVLPKNIWVPQGTLSFKFSEPRSGQFLGKVSSLVTILVNGKPCRRARACAYIECFKRVICAKNGLIRGQLIGPRDISLVRMPISKLKSRFFDDPNAILGLQAKRTVRPGQVIYASSISKPLLVKRGNKVLIVAKSPTIEITCPGVAVENGRLGDFVRVKNIQTKRVIIARVRDSHTVYVNF